MPEGGAGKRDVGDEIARLQNVFQMWRVTRQQIQLADRYIALALRAEDVDARLQRHHGDCHIRRMGCDALVAGAENGMGAIMAADRSASRTGRALVALGKGKIAEIRTPGTLQQIAAGSGHVAELGRCAGEQCLREHRIVAQDVGVVGQLGIAHHCADAE